MDRKKAASFGILLSSFLLIASFSITMAWFGGASFLEVAPFSITVGDKKLQSSTDNETFTINGYTNEDLPNYHEKFAPVTTAFHKKWEAEQSDAPIFYDKYTYSSTRTNLMVGRANADIAPNTSYFSQAIYWKSNTDAFLTLDEVDTFFKPNHQENVNQAKGLTSNYAPGTPIEKIAEDLDNIAYSLRLSLLVLENDEATEYDAYSYYIVDPYKKAPTYYGGVLDNNEDSYFDTYPKDEPGSKEIVYGQLVDDNTDLVKYSEERLAEDIDRDQNISSSIFNAKHRAECYTFDPTASAPEGYNSCFVEEDSIALDEMEEKIQIPLKADISRKVILSLYLEGWDTDNINRTMYAHFQIGLSFKLTMGQQQ